MTSTKNYPCDVCGADKPQEIGVAKQYMNGQSLYTCGDCGFVYVRSRRSAEEIARSWSEEIFQKGYTARIPYVLARQTYVADHIDVTVGLANKTLCDIGAGEGQFLEICKQRAKGVRVYGIEPSTHNMGLLRDLDIEAFHGTIEQYRASKEFAQRKFDVVTMMWTLENCLDCNTMIRTACEMLQEGGKIAIATGSRILVPYKKPLGDYLSTNAADTHCFRFSANALYNLLTKNGFSNVTFNRYLDGDFLIAIGEKNSKAPKADLRRDDPKVVLEYFDRWNTESEWLKKNGLLSAKS